MIAYVIEYTAAIITCSRRIFNDREIVYNVNE